MTQKAKNGVKSVEIAFSILDALMELDGAGSTELAAHFGMPKSTIHNYLSTLLQEELVVKEESKYHVGIRFLEYGAYARQRSNIFEIATPEVDKLADSTGELANLMVEEYGRGSYLHRARGANAVRVESHVGTRVPLHSTALGKTILANLDESRVEEILDTHGLEPVTANTITDRETLYEELETIRERGLAFDDGERIRGLRCVAAPILSNNDRILGAVSVSGPSNRVQGEYLEEELAQKLLETVNVIELNVTYA
ncbi:IclR family transcriptional regulator [Halogeometricum sp. S1BR25-6]|uniref:IclR family transcriptional regulator n=1 Tax=Halogeometricum salsisoli TaxID=2950536 RepID=A0ABU2GJC8_9EURY|nr:IclR family transcriptional regulator [Halogeometricum sp. S1BR25-6]MDS0300173.1 IclR family transcriptional regulator [Halogeometricum sp. S1BR25-6]